jgi:hypothetical protein
MSRSRRILLVLCLIVSSAAIYMLLIFSNSLAGGGSIHDGLIVSIEQVGNSASFRFELTSKSESPLFIEPNNTMTVYVSIKAVNGALIYSEQFPASVSFTSSPMKVRIRNSGLFQKQESYSSIVEIPPRYVYGKSGNGTIIVNAVVESVHGARGIQSVKANFSWDCTSHP